MGREATSYQDTIGRLEGDIAKMKVIRPFVLLSSLYFHHEITLFFCL